MFFAVPAMIFMALSIFVVFKSGSFILAIARSWSGVIDPTTSFPGFAAPFSTPAYCFSKKAVGDLVVLIAKAENVYPHWSKIFPNFCSVGFSCLQMNGHDSFY